jgi:hypothetical protein
MANYQHIVDDIRSFLGSVDQTNSPEVGEWASAYAQLCREANERLRRCGDYLRQGLRSEAIHLAEAQPSLLDMVAALDMPELPDWENLCAMYELPRPPKLLLDVAAELNQAYSAEQPLQSLLRRHRLLALAGAPLHDRLGVMRELSVQDAGSPFWEDDIRTFETARLKELHLEATTAVKGRKLAVVERLLEETKPEHWRAAVPPDLRTGLEKAQRIFRQEQGLAQLRSMLPRLDLAYSAMSYAECNQLLRQWQTTAQTHGVHVPGDLLEKVQPIFDWVRDQTRRRETERQMQMACNQLEEALDAGAPAAELERLLRAAGAFGMTIAEELQRRTAVALREAELARARRVRRNVAITATAVLLLAVGTGFLIWRSIENRNAQNWQRQIAGLLGEEKLQEAEQAWQQMVSSAPGYVSRPELADVRQKLTDAQSRESARAESFRTAMETATAAGTSTPDLSAIAAAERTAKGQEEKLQVYELKAKIELAKKAAAEEREKAFRDELTVLADLVRSVETAQAEQGDGATVKRLGEAQQLAAKLEVMAASLSGESRQALSVVTSRLNAVRRTVSDQTLEREQLAALVSASRSSEALLRAIEAHRAALPDLPRSKELAEAAAEAPAWQAVEAWTGLVGKWAGKMRPASAAAYADRLEEVESYLKAHPRTPLMGAVSAYRDYLERGKSVLGPENPWKRSLADLLSNPFVAELNCIKAPGDKAYYVLKDGQYREGSIGATFDAIVSNNLDRPEPQTLRGASGLKVVRSPQSVMADKLNGQLLVVAADQWEAVGGSLLRTVLEEKELDPILAVIFAEQMFSLMQKHGWQMEFAEPLKHIRDLRADDVAWMNPNDDTATRTRQRAKQVLASLPSPEVVTKQAEAQKHKTLVEASVQLVGSGVLIRDGQAWEARSGSMPPDGALIYAARLPGDVSKPAEWIRVGQCEKQRLVLDGTAARSLAQGTMLFFCKAQ